MRPLYSPIWACLLQTKDQKCVIGGWWGRREYLHLLYASAELCLAHFGRVPHALQMGVDQGQPQALPLALDYGHWSSHLGVRERDNLGLGDIDILKENFGILSHLFKKIAQILRLYEGITLYWMCRAEFFFGKFGKFFALVNFSYWMCRAGNFGKFGQFFAFFTFLPRIPKN